MATEIVEPTIHEHEPTRNSIVVPRVQQAISEDVTSSSAPNTESTTANHNTINSEEDFSAPDLGQPSRNLQVDDFELIKTLGTGTSYGSGTSHLELTCRCDQGPLRVSGLRGSKIAPRETMSMHWKSSAKQTVRQLFPLSARPSNSNAQWLSSNKSSTFAMSEEHWAQ